MLLLGGFVLRQNPSSSSRLHRIFALLNGAAALWNIDVFLLFTLQDAGVAGAVDRLFQPAVISLLFLALLFIYVFLGRSISHPVIIAFGAWTLMLWLISPYDIFISGWERRSWGFYGMAGDWYVLFPVLQAAYLFLTVPPLLGESRTAAGPLRRSQARYLLLANLAFGVLSIDNFLPLYGGERMPAGNLAAVVYFMLIATTMLRHRLLDIRVVLRYSLLYSILAFLLSGAWLLLALGMQGWSRAGLATDSLLLPMVPALLVALAAAPLRNGVQGWIDIRIFPVRTRMKALLAELPALLSAAGEEDRIWRLCWERGWRTVGPRWAALHISAGDSSRVIALGAAAETGREPALRIPVHGSAGTLGCCLFGDKANGVSYGEEEALFLKAVAAQCALAVERARLAEENRRRERLATLGRAAAVVSHELRNPLNVIKGAARLLRSRLAAGDGTAIIAMVEEEIRRGDRFINDFLSACREPDPRRAPVDLAAYVAVFAERCRRGEGLPADVTVEAKAPAPVLADPSQMQQVFENIVRNAVEAAGGRARVAVSCRSERDGGVRLTFIDEGPGIPAEVLPAVFEPFRTSRRNGTGLGLSIVKGIVDAHEGRIEATNSFAGGAQIDIWLPGHPDAEKRSAPVGIACREPMKGEGTCQP
jgi:signal transduction histidine kinase